MIFKCGVGFMRSMSAPDSGCLSGGVALLFEAGARFRFARRHDANAPATQRVADKKKPAFRQADRNETFPGIAMAVVRPFDGEDVLEHLRRRLEPDTVVAPVEGSLVRSAVQDPLFPVQSTGCRGMPLAGGLQVPARKTA